MNKEAKLANYPEIVSAVMRPIVYYDIFDYPLTLEEVVKYAALPLTVEVVSQVLAEMQRDSIVKYYEGYYSIAENSKLIDRRKEGNRMAAMMMPKAEKWAKFVSSFPYVKAVFFSGSLSKNFITPDGDVDYFIIAQEGRLWICRTLLILFKKIFLFNNKKYFCVNYFIGESNLTIEEKNIFTATECATMIPVNGNGEVNRFYESNEWVCNYYPSIPVKTPKDNLNHNPIRTAVEWLLNGRIGELLERRFMNYTIKHWNKKFNHLSKAELEIAFKSSSNVSKHHPNNFQKRVIEAYKKRATELYKNHHIELPSV